MSFDKAELNSHRGASFDKAKLNTQRGTSFNKVKLNSYGDLIFARGIILDRALFDLITLFEYT